MLELKTTSAIFAEREIEVQVACIEIQEARRERERFPRT